MTRIIDADHHFMEPGSVYREHLPAAQRHLALTVEDDDAGWPWLAFRGRRLHPLDAHEPGKVSAVGDARQRMRAGERALPAQPRPDACNPAERLRTLDANGSDEALVEGASGVFQALYFLGEDGACFLQDVKGHYFILLI